MKSGRTLIDLAHELERQLPTKKDLLVPSSLVRYHTDERGNCTVTVDGADGGSTFGITDLARRQLAEKLHIPHAYFERMRSEQPALLDHNLSVCSGISDLAARPEGVSAPP